MSGKILSAVRRPRRLRRREATRAAWSQYAAGRGNGRAIWPGRLAILAGLALGFESGALACAEPPEELKIASSDAVIDGVADCDMKRGRCRLRATDIVKHDARRRRDSEIYMLRFQPGANESLASAMRQAGEIWMCVWSWEPESQRINGRFYLNRAGSSYRLRQESARGDSIVEDDAK